MPLLEFSRAAFWVHIHNVSERSFTQAIGEAIGNTIGKVIVVANPKDDGVGNEFLRVRISIDISKHLSQCRKLWAEGKQVGWVGSKFEHLPNFCYWCGWVTHGKRKCELWLQAKGSLRNEDQQFGEWFHIDSVRGVRKSVTMISGSTRA